MTGPGGRRRRAPDPERIRAVLALGYDAGELAARADVALATARAWLLGQQVPGPRAAAALGLASAAGEAGQRQPAVLTAGLWPGRLVRLVQRPRDQPDLELEIVALHGDAVLEGIARPSGRRVLWQPRTWRTLIPADERRPPPGWTAQPQLVADRDIKPAKVHGNTKRRNAGRLSDPAIPPEPFRARGRELERSLRPGLEVAVFWPKLAFNVSATRKTVVSALSGRGSRRVVRALLLDPAQDWIFPSGPGSAAPSRVYPSRALRWRGLAAAIETTRGKWSPAALPMHHLITTWDEWVNRERSGVWSSSKPRHEHAEAAATEFGQRLTELRAWAEATATSIAALAQITPGILSGLEHGDVGAFRAVALNIGPLSSALRCDPRDLFAPPGTPLLKDTPMPTKPRTPKPAYHGTKIEVSKSKAEAEEIVRRRGCKAYQWTTQEHLQTGRPRHEFRFELKISNGASVRVRLTVNTPETKQRYSHGIGARNVPASRVRRKPKEEVEAEERRLMRVLVAHLKSMFVSAESGLVRIEDVFLAHIEDFSGKTVAEYLQPVLSQLTAHPLTPAMLALGAGKEKP